MLRWISDITIKSTILKIYIVLVFRLYPHYSGLTLTVSIEIIPSSVQGTICNARPEPGSAECKVSIILKINFIGELNKYYSGQKVCLSHN